MTDQHHVSHRQERSSISFFDREKTTSWPSTTVQHPESSLRPTLPIPYEAEHPSRNAHHLLAQHQQQALPQMMSPSLASTAPSGIPTLAQMSIQSLVNRTGTTQSQQIYQSAVFTPVNSSAERPDINQPAWTTAETPLDRPWKMSTTTGLYAPNSGQPARSGFNIDMHEYHSPQIQKHDNLFFANVESLKKDREDGKVYHIGHEERKTANVVMGQANSKQIGSYSGSFTKDKSDQLISQSQKWLRERKERNERPEQMTRCAELVEHCRCLLSAGALLELGRVAFVEYGEPTTCERPFCTVASGIPEDSYYLSLVSDDGLWTFCLRCLEDLWNGRFTGGMPLGEACIQEAQRRDSGIHMSAAASEGPPYSPLTPPHGKYGDPLQNIDVLPRSAINDSLEATCTDKDNFPVAVTPPHMSDEPQEDLDAWDSPSSTISTGEWRHPPTRFQHLASFVTAGASLSDTDRAILALWREASREQIQWDRHLRKMKYTRDYYQGRAEEDIGLSMEKFKEGKEWDKKADADELAKEAGLRKKDCLGRDLSEVLRQVQTMRKKQGSMEQ